MFDDLLFLLSASATVGFTVAVVGTKNLMHACMFLLGTLFGVAGLYATLGADFLAATQIVVYAGGVVILMLFAVMLTGGAEDKKNRFGIEKISSMGSIKTYTIAGVSSLIIAMVVLKLTADVHVASKAITSVSQNESTVFKIGSLLITDHVLAFEISSILLLGALIGAAIIARPKRS
ncbi:MAG: NADH-quinone oxidoreductase subunit J [Bdellovibrio sp.]